MSEIRNTHPFLDPLTIDDSHSALLWSTNTGFPIEKQGDVSQIIPAIQDIDQPVEKPVASEQTPPSHEKQTSPAQEFLTPFAQWLLALKPAATHGMSPGEGPTQIVRYDEIMTPDQTKESGKKKKKKKKKEGQKKVSKSQKEMPVLGKDIVSDTLAELVAGQGHIDEAIAMYRKLVVMNPERAEFYLQRISELRQGKT